MEKAKRKALVAARFQIGDAEEFLGLTEEERRLVDLHIAVGRTVRRLREQRRLAQQQLAAKLQSSQSRIAKLEAGAADVSLDCFFEDCLPLGKT